MAGVGLLILLACGSPKPSTTGAQGAQASSSSPAPAAGPGSTKDNPAPLGTEVTPAEGWAIKIDGPAVDATTDIVRANQFNKPKVATNRWFAVPVSIRNASSRPGTPLSQMKVGALPPNGVRVDQEYAVAGYPTLESMAQLQPGATISGKLVFELDPGAFPQTVLLAEPQFTMDQNADQRFLALK